MGRRTVLCLCMVVGVAALFAANVAFGAVSIPLHDVLGILGGGDPSKESWRFIVLESRLPQALAAILSGSALAVGGLMLQTAFRNPLADPSVFGVSSGAGLGVALAVLLFGGSVSVGSLSLSGFIAVLFAAFVGAMVVIVVISFFSLMVRSSVMLLIIGIMIGYVSSSMTALLNFFATDEGVKSYVVWGMGNFSGVSMRLMPSFAIVVIVTLFVALCMAKPLNILLLGDRYASNLGVNVGRMRTALLVMTGILTAVVTAFCGPISFIGLAVPHLSRLLISTDDHRVLLPATAIMGAVVALACNLLCVIPAGGSIIPLNAVTPLVGAPVVIYIILKSKR